jgi:uncharacterized metal-binding protein YceD (DUF177 family)
MTHSSKNPATPELERPLDLDRIGQGGSALEIVASESERQALARRFGFLSLPAFSARVTVDRRAGGQIVVEGRLKGRIVQSCILTLDPVVQDLDETFRLVFKQGLDEERDLESGEAILSAQADAPEPLSGNMLDVGEIVAEQLSLLADSYPRKPGVKLEDVLPKPRGRWPGGRPEQRRHPFAGLAALRDKPRHRR